MLARLHSFAPVISLVPQSGIQFLDFGLDLTTQRVSRAFLNADDGGHHRLICLYPDEATGQLLDAEGRAPLQPDRVYSLTGARVADTFGNTWLPLPFLRIRETRADGSRVLDQGPSNWVRLWLTELAAADSAGNTHRLTLAFDTQLLPVRQGRPYLAPSPLDMDAGEEFTLAETEPDTLAFAQQDWVAEWLHQVYYGYEARRRAPRRVDPAELRQSLEPLARYLTLLSLLKAADNLPRIRFTYVDLADVTPRHSAPVAVDLVLDIGNSRTCGILVETSGDQPVDLNDSYRLALRSLGHPEQVYDEPFPSRIEFTRAGFGDDRLSRRSGRASAFLWPSVVRVGAEAQDLSCLSYGGEGSTGLSTPKRYLWDTARRYHEWRFNAGADGPPGSGGPVTAGPFVQQLREDGEERAEGDVPAVTALYSRSSLMSFFLSEILVQVHSLINSPAKRYERAHADAPRRLRRLILTVPTAMPLAERRLFSRRVNSAVRLTGRVLGLPGDQVPQVLMPWDEATGTQIVFLYNELREKFQGDAALFFSVFGQVRDGYGSAPALRLASIDIGGGTTDLIITTYALEDDTAVNPTQEFREGFNLAGDDVLSNLIERNLFPSLLDAIAQAGVAHPAELLARLLGGNRGDQSEQERTLRKQFANQVSLPLALRLMHWYETTEPSAGNPALTLRLADVFTARDWPQSRVIAYLEDAVRAAGGREFRLEQVAFTTNLLAVDTTVRRTLGPVLGDLCEVIYHYDCDYLLISGRPCRLPAVRAVIMAKLPVLPDRIVTLHSYKVGDWYPFRAVSGRLTDPKTSAGVGALVCALAEGQLYKFHLRSRRLGLQSTARFVGEMEQTGRIKRERVLFANLELEDRKTRLPEATLAFYAPVFLGFRQLAVERWPATPLYRLTFAQPQDARERALPLRVTLERALAEEGDPLDFKIVEVSDADGNALPRETVLLKLQTLKDDAGYWLDTGIFSIPV